MSSLISSQTVDFLIELALKSEAPNYKVSCMTFSRRGRVLSTAYNQPFKSHPIQALYAMKAGQPERINLHAEILALIRAREPVHTIQVLRVGKKNFTPKPSFPCCICMGYILDSGVKEIVFHDSKGVLTSKTIHENL